MKLCISNIYLNFNSLNPMSKPPSPHSPFLLCVCVLETGVVQLFEVIFSVCVFLFFYWGTEGDMRVPFSSRKQGSGGVC